VARRNPGLLWAAVLVVACGAAEEPATPQQAAVPSTAPAEQATPSDSAVPLLAQSALVRETFAYEGTTRDPFLSLLDAEDVRPIISDLRLVSVIYDAAYPARSVAVLRDVVDGKRYRLRPGDVAGRLRVVQVRPREVVFTVQEFGFERQETLSLRKREETP